MPKLLITRKKCPTCESGELKNNGSGFLQNEYGTYYAHYCESCGTKASLLNAYYPREKIQWDPAEVIEEWNDDEVAVKWKEDGVWLRDKI